MQEETTMETNRISLNSGWRFSLLTDERCAQADFDASAMRPV